MSLEADKSVAIDQEGDDGSSSNSTKNSGEPQKAKGVDKRACAACKYQRRRCAPDCLLAPYFPAENQKQFLNCHRLFGLRNIAKVLKQMQSPQKDIAIRSMIIQANVRANDPVGGCYKIIQDLKKQIEMCDAELAIVNDQLARCRRQTVPNQLQRFGTADGFNTAMQDGIQSFTHPVTWSGLQIPMQNRNQMFNTHVTQPMMQNLAIASPIQDEIQRFNHPLSEARAVIDDSCSNFLVQGSASFKVEESELSEDIQIKQQLGINEKGESD